MPHTPHDGRDLSAMPAMATSMPQSSIAYSRQADVSSRPNDWSVGSTPPSSLQRPIGGSVKRILDIVVSGTALLMAVPLLVAIAAAIKLTMGGPAVYSHTRIGFSGQAFQCYKFRTMIADADQVLAKHLAANPAAAAEWAERRKLSHDPRITFLGRMLRISSLDELPQLLNILRGDMSCVGPRPIVAGELELYGEVAELYLRARPGLTGLWQVSGRDNVSYARRVQLDRSYLQNWSMALDAMIVFKTIFVLMKMNDAS